MKSPRYKGGFEPEVAANLKARGVPIVYEETAFSYVVNHLYTPDFELPNGIFIEAKGYLSKDDRSKMIKVRQQNEEMDIRFVFQAPENKIYKGSKTTYGMWADRNGFKWANKAVPKDWIDE